MTEAGLSLGINLFQELQSNCGTTPNSGSSRDWKNQNKQDLKGGNPPHKVQKKMLDNFSSEIIMDSHEDATPNVDQSNPSSGGSKPRPTQNLQIEKKSQQSSGSSIGQTQGGGLKSYQFGTMEQNINKESNTDLNKHGYKNSSHTR